MVVTSRVTFINEHTMSESKVSKTLYMLYSSISLDIVFFYENMECIFNVKQKQT